MDSSKFISTKQPKYGPSDFILAMESLGFRTTCGICRAQVDLAVDTWTIMLIKGSRPICRKCACIHVPELVNALETIYPDDQEILR